MVKITVDSNGLPNHCFYDTTPNTAEAIDNTWTVNWNPDVTGKLNYQASDFDSESKTTEILCDIQRTSSNNMMSESGYVL